MSVTWAATDTATGRFVAEERRTGLGELTDHVDALRRCRGEGYLEVRLPDREFPVVTLGFRDERAVLHVFEDADTVSLRPGDGTTPADAVVEVPVMDEPAVFSGDMASSLDAAWSLLHRLLRSPAV
ncbi:hypothetical protein [Streptomyces galbus]|nr:hypothetical protein [Streptomyces galbus]GHD54410.1 hypothetical protein GCM10010335_68810 [Streptomyces galbus]